MPARIYRTEIAGELRVGIEFDTELELEEFLGSKGIVLVYAPASLMPAAQQLIPLPAESPIERRGRGRPSRDEQIAVAIDTLDEQLEACGSIKAQAHAVRAYLEDLDPDGEAPPGLSTIETYISVYRRPRSPSALKIAQKFKRG